MAPRSFFPALFAFAASAGAQEAAPPPADPKTQPGHSMHGEVFNEGPRQAARLIPGTGAIRFPVTTKNEDAQRFVEQGIGQLHGFWYWEAERSFRQAAALDPDCAMAFWGMAMANFNNSKRAGEFIRKAAALKEKVSRREQLWITSLEKYLQAKGDENARRDGLVKALEELSYEFPDDLEAKAFLVFHIWDNKNHGMAIPSRQAIDALAQQVLAVNPRHPGAHHYLIHLWNYGKGDKRALPSAALCGQSAPGIAHMWHMPGHTFSELKRHADAAWQQEASARVDHAYLMENRVLPDQIHNFAHNNEWLTRSLASIGRVHDSVDLAKNMIELPRLGSKKGQSYRFGRDRLLDTLVKFELWDELVALGETAYLDPFDDPLDEVRRRRALGLAWLHKRNAFECEVQTAALNALRENVRAARMKGAEDAEMKAKKEKKSDDQIARAMADALRSFNYRLDQIENALAELEAVRAQQSGAIDQARARLEAARDIPAERRARIYYALGDGEKALELARDAAKPEVQQLQPQANLADLLWRAGKKDDAIATFEKLRPLSARLDLDVPVFARLAPIAAELKLPEDWRALPTTPADIGQRPELNSLGPFRWQPQPAADWALPDERGNIVSLRDYAGRAVLIVFYLGSGCSHCIEQLNIFSPLTAEYATAGISMVAVSTDSQSGLKETFAKAKEGSAFSFPILADPEMNAFKAYRAFDDFERAPLHGIFLVDRRGLLRWHDISHEPFRDATWLLGEAKRLLKIDPEPHGAAARVTFTR